ncbi:MAG: DEAD/DEAH box helicase, partial [Aeromonadaceae bacterium]|nr:DEAD/DEAH box helicase [Aeromonadaceae bacterium]
MPAPLSFRSVILRFDELSLHPRLQQAIDHLGFTQVTEIQQRAIPQILSCHDLAASSKTGSGKTLAFLLPMVQRLLTSKVLGKRGPRALILAPTRELAKQVYGQLRLLLGGTNLKGALILGGENFNDQTKQLLRIPQIVVGTPGRIANHLQERSLFIDGLELLILDEADRMLDLGFANELKQIHEAASHRLRQTLMFSATLAHTEFEELATVLLDNPHRITVGQELAPHEDIEQRFILCDHLDHKEALLEHLLRHESYQQAIIFTATRADTERLAQLFNDKGLSAAALSGELKQNARNAIMDGFSRGHHKLLFTTDIASRGLDLVNVSLVINFDMPKAAEEFIHRIGRTGRAGSKGQAISLISAKDWAS